MDTLTNGLKSYKKYFAKLRKCVLKIRLSIRIKLKGTLRPKNEQLGIYFFIQPYKLPTQRYFIRYSNYENPSD